MFQLTPDWCRTYPDRRALEADMQMPLPSANFQGWVEDKDDTCLITQSDGGYTLRCWNRPDAREMLKAVLELPVHRT